MKNILIIVYKFPPMGGIGTRRWAKFSKYLAKKGYKVHILTSYYPYIDSNNWENDIINKNIVIHNFKSYYPYWLLNNSKNNFFNKFKRLIRYVLHKSIFFIDNAQYDAKPILTKSKELITKYNIKNVISSGHPVSINYISTYLKIDLPNINLIQDYRDNWNDLNIYQYGNKDGFSFFKFKKISAYQEFFTLYYSDLIINVSEDLTNSLKSKHNQLSDKLITITNGYDEEDFINTQNDDSEFNMIYAGSLFNHRIEAINLILDAIIDLNDKFINENFKIIIYSNYDKERLDLKYKKLINKNIYFNNFIAPNEVISIISKNRYCLSINSKFASYAFGTKVFDYMGLNKKILHISNGGTLYNILEKENQFVCNYDLHKMKNILLDLKNDFINKNISNGLDYKEYSITKLTNYLEKHLD